MSSLSFVVSTRTGNELEVNRPKTVKLSDGDCGIRRMDEITLFFIFSLHLLEMHWEWFTRDDEIPLLAATSDYGFMRDKRFFYPIKLSHTPIKTFSN
ncbi:hypothetical protein Bca101_007852 [Brassica carinata]